MIEGLKPYPEMKRSGAPWLGDVPAHWHVRRIKRLLRERSEKGHPNEPMLAATQTKGVVRKEDFGSRTVIATGDLGLLKLVEVDDFVISLRSFQGGIEYARHRGIISPAYNVLVARDPGVHSYLAALFKAKPFIDGLSLFVTGIRQGQNIDYERLGRSAIAIPPADEQAAIVRFLDHADRKIGRHVRAKQKMAKLLEEQKRTVIHRVVTRGLDPNVPQKASGNPWVPLVPEHWEVLRGKCYFREIDERSCNGDEELLSVSHKTGVTPRSDKNITMFMAQNYSGHKICRPGDIAVNTMWAWMAAIGVSSKIGIVSPSYGVYRLRDSNLYNSQYLDLVLRTEAYRSAYLLSSRGITTSRLRLYPEDFLRIRFIRPPLEEQGSIVEWISDAVADLNLAVDVANREVSLLREYHSGLIADVITGKLDVRAAAAALPDVSSADIDDDDLDADLDEGVDLEGEVDELDSEEAI